ncbi:MAG: hypothetical protein LBC19_13650 [Tannerella sp.]|jgi:hypothetical protein|nr:hypothetical protein [Tannerella sp.]
MLGISFIKKKKLERLRNIDAAFNSILQKKDEEILLKDKEIAELKIQVNIWKRVAESPIENRRKINSKNQKK